LQRQGSAQEVVCDSDVPRLVRFGWWGYTAKRVDLGGACGTVEGARRAKQRLTCVEDRAGAKAAGYNGENERVRAYSKLNAGLVG